jgi:RimJ/RimL family protein N-acetyltransferase
MSDNQKGKRQKGRDFRKAVDMELKEHKSSFLVFSVLRLLVILVLARQFMQRNYESVFLCALTLLLLYVPSWVQVKLRIELPPALEITVLCFIFAAEILGEINEFYIVIPFWDTILHTLNGFLCAAVGFSLVVLLNDSPRLTFDLSPFFMAMTAFCFSMTIGVLWEFFEFSLDRFLHFDCQKDTVIHAIYSVALNPSHANKVVSVTGITDAAVNGESLGVGGYLDVGLIDTMKDLFVNFIGAVVFSVTGFFYARSKGKTRTAAQSFVPSPKAAGRDFLKAVQQESERNNRQNKRTTTMILRQARKGEARVCYQFIEDARAYHKSMGFEQWHSDYPTLQTVEDDIKNGTGYVFAEGDAPIGYCCIIVGDEPAYHVIDGAWKTDRAYAVVHRMAFGAGSRGKGLSKDAFSLIKELCEKNEIDAVRVDTQSENKVMQHILAQVGFAYCGLVTFDGGPKLAYEWDRWPLS